MRLGPQGMAVYHQLQGSQQQRYELQVDHNRTPQQLDFVLDEILNPRKTTTPTKVLSYLAYYYPKIKNANNVALLTYNFMKCPIFFNDSKIVSLENNYQLIEFFQYIVLHKYRISLPHLSFENFYKSLTEGIRSFVLEGHTNLWKVIPVISGILSTKLHREDAFKIQDRELVRIWHRALLRTLNEDQSCISNYEITSISLISASFNLDQLPKGIHDYTLFLSDLIYRTKLNKGHIPALDWRQDPVLKNMNKLALLINQLNCGGANYLIEQKVTEDLMFFCENMCRSARAHEDLELAKNIIFTDVIILENVINKCVENSPPPLVRSQLSRKILMIFYYSNFIFDRIGVGGFNQYNYIYYYSIDTLMSDDRSALENMVMTMMASIDFNALNANYNEAARLKFVLNLVENVISESSSSLQNYFFPFVQDLTVLDGNRFLKPDSEYFVPILESAHSVVLKYMDLKFFTQQQAAVYTNLLFVQYPKYLSIAQITTCLKKLLANKLQSYAELSIELYHRIIYTSPNIMIKDEHIHTLRSSLILLHLYILEFCPIEVYEEKLELLHNLIRQIADPEDFKFLMKTLFDTIMLQNRADVRKGSIGLSFWMSHVEKKSHL